MPPKRCLAQMDRRLIFGICCRTRLGFLTRVFLPPNPRFTPEKAPSAEERHKFQPAEERQTPPLLAEKRQTPPLLAARQAQAA